MSLMHMMTAAKQNLALTCPSKGEVQMLASCEVLKQSGWNRAAEVPHSTHGVAVPTLSKSFLLRIFADDANGSQSHLKEGGHIFWDIHTVSEMRLKFQMWHFLLSD